MLIRQPALLAAVVSHCSLPSSHRPQGALLKSDLDGESQNLQWSHTSGSVSPILSVEE